MISNTWSFPVKTKFLDFIKEDDGTLQTTKAVKNISDSSCHVGESIREESRSVDNEEPPAQSTSNGLTNSRLFFVGARKNRVRREQERVFAL